MLSELCLFWHHMTQQQWLNPVPILDFWGLYAERGGWRVWLKKECNAFVCVSLNLESRSWKALISSAARYSLNSGFFSRARDCTIFTLHNLTDFYVESVTAHRIKINDHSCFHNLWPNSKTKLKLKHLWEQALMFRGPYAACVFCV